MVAVLFVAVTRQAPNANCHIGRTGNGNLGSGTIGDGNTARAGAHLAATALARTPHKTRTPRERGVFYRDWSLRRRRGIDLRSLRFWRSCEPLAERSKILELTFRQLVVPIAQVLHCIVEPLDLVLRLRADHTAPHDVLEQLIAGLFEYCGLRNLSATT